MMTASLPYGDGREVYSARRLARIREAKAAPEADAQARRDKRLCVPRAAESISPVMRSSFRELDRVLTGHFGRRGAAGVYLAFIVAGLAALLGFAWNQVQGARNAASEITVAKRSVKPERAPPTSSDVTLDVSEPLWKRNADGRYRVLVNIDVVSKFQRSGLFLYFNSESVEGMAKLLPVNKQPTVHGTYVREEGLYVHYIQRPWGQYFLAVALEKESDVVFKYKFEGEEASSPVVWKAP